MSSSSDLFEEFGQNSGFIQELYQLYQTDPSLVGDTWATFFSAYDSGKTNGHVNGSTNGHAASAQFVGRSAADLGTQEKVSALIESYRVSGHFAAKINPLTKGVRYPAVPEELSLEHYGFSSSDLQSEFACAGLGGSGTLTLREIAARLQKAYCGSIGFEYMHLVSSEEREFLRTRIEGGAASRRYDAEQQKRIFGKLVDGEEFENLLHRKYVGQKRFSLQGGETVIPMLDVMLTKAAAEGVEASVLGMAHRGRLNVLANTIAKPLDKIFSEFEDQALYSVLGAGDVKYHKGYHSLVEVPGGRSISVELAPNPSHLEFVDPVVEGIARARQDLEYGARRDKVLPVLIHGDAAFAGQGIVYETLNYSVVAAYATGGTFHLVINNQIGFTTNPEDARSSAYCTDMARGIGIPVFHVNCEDLEACCRVVELAIEFRQKFSKDVIVDLYCYRKYGHNEADDPSFTQPIAYSEITKKRTAAQIYGDQLVAEGVFPEGGPDGVRAAYVNHFNESYKNRHELILGEACAMHGRLRIPTPPTGVAKETLTKIAATLTDYPQGFKPHPKLHAILEKRVQTLHDGKGIEWGFAEGLALGSLLLDGYRVRFTGQDVGRGTFSQRHLALNNYEAPERWIPFSRLAERYGAAAFELYNSTLSEGSVVGFEFGYAAVAPKSLVLWEAQFGDFVNGAQVALDQFISSSEAKWDQLSGVVLLLPHGFEGQGAEHSSARLERFLQLAGEGNMVVAYPSSAAQQFHLLRRQGIMEMKRPLIVMTPKSLLRLPEAAATDAEITSGQFQTIIDEPIGKGPAKHLVFLTGKVYYEVKAALVNAEVNGVRLMRIEQLYPFPQFELKKALKDVNVKSCLWVQEEPQNMGAWSYIEPYLRGKLDLNAEYFGRPAAASPATGSLKRHNAEQKQILEAIVAAVK